MTAADKVPVTILTGFLGAGTTVCGPALPASKALEKAAGPLNTVSRPLAQDTEGHDIGIAPLRRVRPRPR